MRFVLSAARMSTPRYCNFTLPVCELADNSSAMLAYSFQWHCFKDIGTILGRWLLLCQQWFLYISAEIECHRSGWKYISLITSPHLLGMGVHWIKLNTMFICLSVHAHLLDAGVIRMGTILLELRGALPDVRMIQSTTVQLYTSVSITCQYCRCKIIRAVNSYQFWKVNCQKLNT